MGNYVPCYGSTIFLSPHILLKKENNMSHKFDKIVSIHFILHITLGHLPNNCVRTWYIPIKHVVSIEMKVRNICESRDCLSKHQPTPNIQISKLQASKG